ncbi:hypothetical protein K435DRAFT_815325 [Dendrothele bispora CBS 962.96]|uniref:N-acetyltransferase domain-containing protein n=1 Tax=Dendrothele bispora (strain CBS 962.96) TaxID=1314807 RepID=A0A4S8MVW2_DENBC|nr:hypothetical protein K435DRAFT_815325 [Dendrothele bispora CBS 962.96]
MAIICQHTSAEDVLDFTFSTLTKYEESSNIVFAQALQSCATPYNGGGGDVDDESWRTLLHRPNCMAKQFWLTVWTIPQTGFPPKLDIFLSCVGEAPIFLWTPRTHRADGWLESMMQDIVRCLCRCVRPERVFSVFGKHFLVTSFAEAWSKATGFTKAPEPYYDALSSRCTLQTFIDDNGYEQNHIPRTAELADMEKVAMLCKEFAETSVHFPLSEKKAKLEARRLISCGRIWVYQVGSEIVAICAVARESQGVAAITKVYTEPKWRKRGCAERLVRLVTKRMLVDEKKKCVVLYAGINNSAQHVYDRIGFQGLCGKPREEGLDDVLEIGFLGTEKGHW